MNPHDRIEDWFFGDDGFAERLIGRIRNPDGGWPDLDDDWWQGVFAWMERARVRPQEAQALLNLAQEEGIHKVDATIKVLKKLLNEHRKERSQLAADLEEAARLCRDRDCECQGTGLISRAHEKPGYGPYTASYYCDGAMGHRIEASHHAKGLKRIARLPAHLAADADPVDVTATDAHKIGRHFVARAQAIRDGRPPPEAIDQLLDRRLRHHAERIRREGPRRPAPPPPPRHHEPPPGGAPAGVPGEDDADGQDRRAPPGW